VPPSPLSKTAASSKTGGITDIFWGRYCPKIKVSDCSGGGCKFKSVTIDLDDTVNLIGDIYLTAFMTKEGQIFEGDAKLSNTKETLIGLLKKGAYLDVFLDKIVPKFKA